MLNRGSKASLFIILLIFVIFSLYSPDQCLSSGGEYSYDRLWPVLYQPWYFFPYAIASDNDGNLYIADNQNHRISKYNSSGQFVTTWGSEGADEGMFDNPKGIALDREGYIYVADSGNDRIQKFTPDGEFVALWGKSGSGDGELDNPLGITSDESGFIYVADSNNSRIVKFTDKGEYLAATGGYGTGNGEFSVPYGIDLDKEGNIYVTDYGNNNIQKFTRNGLFVTKWGFKGSGNGEFWLPTGIEVNNNGFVFIADSFNNRVQVFNSDGKFLKSVGGSGWLDYGFGDGEFYWPFDIAFDQDKYIYVADMGNNRIQKFTVNGEFVTKWGSIGVDNGSFARPLGISVDKEGYVYVTDWQNHRIQKFSSDGRFILSWGSYGSGQGEFVAPSDTAVDSDGNVYVTDTSNFRIQKFTTEGVFIKEWGEFGKEPGSFSTPRGIAVDDQGNVYVTENDVTFFDNHRVQKFTGDGLFVTGWGSLGSGEGEFNNPNGIAIDSDGIVSVADTGNNRIQRFNSEGIFVGVTGEYGTDDGQFDFPHGLDVDKSGNIYVTEMNNARIQKFSKTGEFITKLGSQGSDPNQLNGPSNIAVDDNGRIYVSEYFSNRIQVFKETAVSDNIKAVIVAGGGAFSGDNLWDSTLLNANYAYRTLIYQGFTKENIYYLNPDNNADLDSNGLFDDIDADSTIMNLKTAITEWATDADSVVLYMIDHGGVDTFRMNENETLSSDELASWIDEMQRSITGAITIVYDACESGTFISTLTGQERVVITSTSPGESAYFIAQGTISFSNFFWTQIFNGLSVWEAYQSAGDAMTLTTDFQHPMIDDNGNGTGNDPDDGSLALSVYIGSGTEIYGDAPIIGSVSPEQTISGTTSALIYADNVTDSDGIARVWAIIRPPYFSQGSSENPVVELPTIELTHAGENRYEGVYNSFNITGTYQISIYAIDGAGNTAQPELTTISVDSDLTRKAVIVAGDVYGSDFWSAVEHSTRMAYETLSFQGYDDNDIYLLSPVAISGVNVLPAAPDLSNLEYVLTEWASVDTEDLVLYLTGRGGDGYFEINGVDYLYASVLGLWLNDLQSLISGTVTVIYDASLSAGFLPALTPQLGKERIVIASTGDNEAACFLSNGDISFSSYFWMEVSNGASVNDSFDYAGNAISFTCKEQIPQLDDNGNGIGNEKTDGIVADNYLLGFGIMLGGDAPIIGAVSPNQTLYGELSAVINADNVTTTGTIARVWAVIRPPDFNSLSKDEPLIELPEFELTGNVDEGYEGVYENFSVTGAYEISVYAKDGNGNVSLPKTTKVIQEWSKN